MGVVVGEGALALVSWCLPRCIRWEDLYTGRNNCRVHWPGEALTQVLLVLRAWAGQGPVELSNRAIEFKLLEELLDTYAMFMSHDFDITHTHQRLAERRVAPSAAAAHPAPPLHPASPPPARAVKVDYSQREERFVWNSKALRALEPGAAAWHSGCLVPVVTGFVCMQPVTGAGGAGACMALIARREWHRCGYRCPPSRAEPSCPCPLGWSCPVAARACARPCPTLLSLCSLHVAACCLSLRACS